MAVSCGDGANDAGVHPTKAITRIAGRAMNLDISSENVPKPPTMVATVDDSVEMEDGEMLVEVAEVGEATTPWSRRKGSRKQTPRGRKARNRMEAGRQENRGRARIFRGLHPLKSKRGWSTVTKKRQKTCE